MPTVQNPTLAYYEANARSFVQDTVSVDFALWQERFLALLPAGADVLDFGCGSGRDSLYFLQHGLHVTAIDGSRELCALASALTGLAVRKEYFEELSDVACYDGIWACASILHVRRALLPDVLLRMKRALRPGGIVYTSFKYGDFEGERHGRYFTNMTEESLDALLREAPGFTLLDSYVSGDVRPGRSDEKWLNLFLRKA